MNKIDIKEDILKEIININVGQAASLLSEIVDKKIELRVPQLKILDGETDFSHTDCPNLLKGALMVSSIKFENELNGKAELIFPANHIKELTSLCTGEECFDLETFTDTDFDVIKELGNIILNAVIGGLGNFLNMAIDYSMPEVKLFDTIEVQEVLKKKKKANILILFVNFKIGGTQVNGALIVTFTIDSMRDLMDKLDEVEKGL